jgi:tetratricopeptide (TPR) repeat protein
MGVVYRARGSDGADLAIKVLPSGVTGEARERFLRERRLAASLGEAEGFVPVVGQGETAQGLFLAMPLVGGGSLRSRLAHGPLSVAETARLGRALARALARAHALGIVHRDLKPENVLFTKEGRPLLCDLGLAKHFRRDAPDASRSASVSQTGTIAGTLGYMSPEQLDDFKAAKAPADVFALGAILHECLSGRRAFEGGVLTIAERIGRGATPIQRLRPETPTWLARAVDRALAADPLARFADGLTLERALVAPASRRWIAFPIVGLVLVAAALAATLYLAPRGRPIAPLSPAKPPPAHPPPPPAESAAQHLVRARALLASSDVAAAISEASAAIAVAPRLVDALTLRAEAWSESTGPWIAVAERVAEDANRAIDVDPRNAAAFALRSRAAILRGDVHSALADAERAVALEARSALALEMLGRARCDSGDPLGIADLDAALAIDPDRASALSARSSVRAALGNLEGAVADADRAVELRPGSTVFLCTRGALRSENGNRNGALADFDRAIELDPSSARAYGLRGKYHLDAGEDAAAIADLGRAIDLEPGSARVWAARGDARRHHGELQAAVLDYGQAIVIDPRCSPAFLGRGLALAALGDRVRAADDLRHFLDAFSDTPRREHDEAVAKLAELERAR